MDYRDWGGPINQSSWFDTWILWSDNQTDQLIMVYQPQRQSVLVFGSVLCAWSIFCNLLVAVLVARKHQYYVNTSNKPLRWLILHFTLAQLAQAAFVVPLSVHTERTGYWVFGPVMCRVWLVAGVSLVAQSLWALFFITLDRLLYVLQPVTYDIRMRGGRVLLMVACSLLLSLLTLVPITLAMQHPDFVLEDVCAISMSRDYAFATSFIAFFVPAFMTICLTVITLIVTTRTRLYLQCEHWRPQQTDPTTTLNPTSEVMTNSSATTTSSCARTKAYEWSKIASLLYCGDEELYSISLTVGVANFGYLALWTPFYVTNLMIPFCQTICVNPLVWSLLIWLGYSTAGISPIIWFLDLNIRGSFKQVLREGLCVQEKDHGSRTSSIVYWAGSDHNVFRDGITKLPQSV